MHGQFYNHFTNQQNRTAQNPSGTTRTANEQQARALYRAQQHGGVVNGQAYPTHQQQQQARVQPTTMQQHAAGLTQQYNQLLQSQAYYLQQQQNRQQQEQHRLLQQHQQQQVPGLDPATLRNLNSDPTTLHTLLASTYGRNSFTQMQMQNTLNQLGLGQASVSPHGVPSNLHGDHMQSANKVMSQSRIMTSQPREIPRQREPVANQAPPPLRNIQAQTSSQAVLNQDLLRARHLSPTTPGRSPTGFHQTVGGNVFSNILISPTNNAGMVQGHRGAAFSPAMGHIAQMGMNNRPQNMQMTHTEITTTSDIAGSRNISYGSNPSTTPGRSVSRDLQSPQRPTPTGTIINTNIHVKRQTSSVNSCTAPVIISDSEDEEGDKPSTSTAGEKKAAKAEPSLTAKQDFTRVVIDDDIEITGMREAEIMSHMRSDCPIHPFKRVDSVDSGPQDQNASKCIKCFCYVCDKIASECNSWTTSTFPHCNAHSRASCWKARRNTKKSPLMLKLALEDLTPEMEQAGEIAMQYMITIRESYITYRAGTPCEYNAVPCNCTCHKISRGNEPCHQCKVVHDMKKKFNYEPVRETALKIIREIQSKYSPSHPEMAIIMYEAVLSELCSQRPADFNHSTRTPSNPDVRCQCNFPDIVEKHIEKDLIDLLTRFEVSQTFKNHLIKCVDDATRPLQLKDIMKKFIGMRHWDNLLLRAVLTGSNTTGSKGREVLRETADIVKMRVEKLDREKRYHSILRYLKVVKILQSQKSGISNSHIMALMDQWLLLYKAKQGLFKDVAFRLTESSVNNHGGVALGLLQPDFLIELLDVLAGYDIPPNTTLRSFDPSSSQAPYQIKDKDADVLLLLFVFIIQQNQAAVNHIPIYLWIAKWVNRNRLSPCLDPAMIKPLVDQGTGIMELAKRAYSQGNCAGALMQCRPHDPHVHLFVASVNIVNAVAKLRNLFKQEHIQAIMEAYKTNEWALFHLLSQSALMNFGDVNIIRWLTKFCDHNPGSITQIKDRVLIESIQLFPLDNISELLKALIKPDWLNSVESIQRTVIAMASEYSLRLLEELKRNDAKVLIPKSKWLEDIILKNIERIRATFIREERVLNQLKNVAKTCSFVNPTRKNIEMYQKISPNLEWYRRCNALIQFLEDKFLKLPLQGTMEEFSSLLSLLWSIGDIDRLKARLMFFEERHSCNDDGVKVTSSKVLKEIAAILDVSMHPNYINNKLMLMEGCNRLCVVETLSWLTCAECARKMPTGWTDVWVSIMRSQLTEKFEHLNQEMITQFKKWLNQIPLDNSESYKRLLVCLRSFVTTLVITWTKCSLNLDRAYRLLMDISASVTGQILKRDFATLSSEIIKSEKEKLQPKVTEIQELRQPNNIRPPDERHVRPPAPPVEQTRPAPPDRQARTSIDRNPPPNQRPQQQAPQPQHTRQQRAPSGPQGPPPLIKNNDVPTKPPAPSQPPRQAPSNAQPSKPVPDPKKVEAPTSSKPSQKRDEPRTNNKPHAVMSTDALFKKTATSRTVSNPDKPAIQKGESQKDQSLTPFSAMNRTKTCQNCGETISCASFRCPKCNQAARSVQPVTCPGCGQENRELKGYSCQYCYRSLLDVLFQGGECPPVSSDEPRTEPKANKRKKKSEDKRRKRSKVEESASIEQKISFEKEKSVATQNEKKISPLTLKVPHKPTLDDTTDSDLDDFITEKPKKKRKRHTSLNTTKVPPIKLKRKPSIISSPPRGVMQESKPANIGVSLTDSDSDSDENDKNALIISPEFYVDANKSNADKPRTLMRKSSETHNTVHPRNKMSSSSLEKIHSDNGGKALNIPKPHFYINMNNKHQSEATVSPQRNAGRITHNPTPNTHNIPSTTHNAPPSSHNVPPNTHNAPPTTHNAPAKRGVGHSSMMSKKQKNILSRLKRPGMGAAKAPTSLKTTPPNASSNKDVMRSPTGYHKRSSLDNGPTSSPIRGQGDLLRQNERQRHDSSCSSGSVSSIASALSFGLASVEQKRPRNVGHRTGGPPSSKKYETNRSIIDENVSSNSKKTLFPTPLNSEENRIKKKKKKKHKDKPMKKITLTERKLDAMIAKRKPGPASKTGYRRLLKLSHKLKKLQRASPHKSWRLSTSVKIPHNADLSRYARVTLMSFPPNKLTRIRNLVPKYRIPDLFA